jgi:hypothetical protein
MIDLAYPGKDSYLLVSGSKARQRSARFLACFKL